MVLYHRTSRENAERIIRSKTLQKPELPGYSAHYRDNVWASSHKSGQADGYGDAVIAFDVDPRHAVLDDEFPSGEKHYTVHHKHAKNPRLVSDEAARADDLIRRALSEGEVIRRAFGAGNAMVRHPHETLAPAQIPAEDLAKYVPDSYPAQAARGTSGVKLQRGRKNTTLASTQRIANPDGSFREKSVLNNAFFGKDPEFKDALDKSGQWITRRPGKDRFTVSLSRGWKENEDKTQRRPWKDLLTARGLGAFHQHLSTFEQEGDDRERSDFAHLAFDNAHSAVETARLLDGDKHYKIRHVQHERQFLPSPGDEGWHDVGTIDHTKGVDSEGRVTYAHSMHGLVDHAKKVGRPHRCPKEKGTVFTTPCSSARGCANVKLNESTDARGLPIEVRRMSPDTAKKLADALKKGLADRGKTPPRPTPRADRMVRECLR